MLRSDNLIPLTGGAYQARSSIADYEVCENLFPETNPQTSDPPTPVTHYPREGKRPLSLPPVVGKGRGLFTLSNGNLFAGVGPAIYYIDPNWNWNLLGQVADLPTPISMSDNRVTAVIVDGTSAGYTIDLGSNTFAALVDPTGTFGGSVRTDFADTFLAFATPGTNRWQVTLSNQVAFNALVQASKDTYPDPIQTLAFNLRQAWLIGAQTSEVWNLAGSTPFPYQEWPNIFVPYGCSAPYSLVRSDVDLFWLARNKEGQNLAVKTNGYAANEISTAALNYEWTNYPTVADAIGGTFQQAGHTFIIFHFPTADKTWAYDLATKQWHRRTWADQNGVAHREKTSFYATVSPDAGYPATIVGQDWATGQIYALDPKYYLDDQTPIICRRTFPHVMKDMHEITHTAFIADFETGGLTGLSEQGNTSRPWNNAFNSGFGPQIQSLAPALCMRYSNNGGASFGNYRQKTLISAGHYRSMMRWRGLGMARDRVYELLWSYAGPSALQGAYIEPIEHAA